ncbi:MAG: hypothetical protein QOF84_796 [Streptomyces sp.]|jgi:polyisoprenoid-binding protein YceI|nr:hypothetical protein [Streptomyces sp.]MDX6346006.1 hypothetical protein [Streptomyces sp.]
MSDTTAGSRHAIPLTDVAPGRWTLDPAGSTVAFEHKSIWGLVNVKGTFTKISGEGEVLPGGSAHGTVTIDTASVDTQHKKRDIHLRSADFLDVDTHQSITFTATSVSAGDKGTVEVSGELTVTGTSRPLAFTAEATEVTADAVTLTAGLTVNRKDFGLTWNQLGMVKDISTLAITARFTRLPA